MPIHIVCAMGDIDLVKIITNFGRENLCVKTPVSIAQTLHLAIIIKLNIYLSQEFVLLNEYAAE